MSPQHAYSPANQSLALGNNALVMHIQCMYYTAILSPSSPCDLGPQRRIEATQIETDCSR
jgi:hypothetical protein